MTVKRLSGFVMQDEQAFAEELQHLATEKQEAKPQIFKAELGKMQKRYDELSNLIRGLYENMVSGLLPERQYRQLMQQYDSEQCELEERIEEIQAQISAEKDQSTDIKRFISIIRNCKNPDEISDRMFRDLIDKIVVHEAEGKGRNRTQQVDIYFNYVGQVEIALTEEEIAEQKALAEQEEQERIANQRAKEKKRREERKAKLLEANGGEIIKKKICPHCGAEFDPTSNRQVYCTKDCRTQARQEEKEAKRIAERGEHFYRQRECEICGAVFWPNSSGQRYCSEDCQKQVHNKSCMDYYFRKREQNSENENQQFNIQGIMPERQEVISA